MRLKVELLGDDVSDSVLATSLEISQNITDKTSSARLTFKLESTTASGEVSRYDEVNYDEATYGVDVRELQEIVITERASGIRQFAGRIMQLRPVRKRTGLLFIECDCLDWGTLLDEAYVVDATFVGQTDRQIIQALVAAYQPELTALTANIASTAVIPTWTVQERTLREALDELCEFTGLEYRVDYSKNLLYFEETAFPAPFGLSSEPDNFLTFGIDAATGYNKDAVKIINRCTILGAVQPGGQRLKAVYDDPISQLQYGVRPHTEVDDQVTVSAVAMLRAKAVVEENAYPQESLTIRTVVDGLQVGQLLPVFHSTYLIDGNYLIRELSMRQVSRTKTEYSLTVGTVPPDTLRVLKQINARSRRNTQAPTAIPGAGTVTDSSIASGGLSADVIGTVNADSIIGSISAGQIGSVNAAVIAGAIDAEQIGTVDAGSIQGAITADQIGSVNATSIEGVIISSQVADGLIDSLSKIAAPLRAIPNVATAPALPDPNLPLGSFYYNTTSGTFFRNDEETWTPVPEGTAVAGKLEYFHIGTIKASKIVGAILAAQIDTINASQIVGTLSSDVIGTINASSITGSLTADHIATVNASSIQGSISHTQIGSVNASTITVGQIQSTQIASVNAATITIGTLGASQIGSLNGAVINVGTVGDSAIANVSAGKINTGTLNAALISVINLDASSISTGSFSASRIGAGTITASITINSPSINGGTITGAAFSISSGSLGAISISSSDGVRVSVVGDPSSNTIMSSTGISINSGAGLRVSLSRATGNGVLGLYTSGGVLFFEVDPGRGTTGGGTATFNPVGYMRVTIQGVTRSIPFF